MEHVSIIPDTLFHMGALPVTNTLFTSWIVVILLSVTAIVLSTRLCATAGKLQNVVELVIETLIDFLSTIAGSREKAIRFFPIVATIFFFILASNWIGILPGVGSIGFYHTEAGKEIFSPLFRSVNSDLNMTLALALIVITLSHVTGFVAIGAGKHIGKFISFKSSITFFVGLLEFIGEFAKIVSFSFRLFGNVFAGEVLLIIISYLIPYVVPVPFLGLEVFVGLIQALIFAVLAMMFFSAATEHAHH